jgi:hypothetical protein
MPLVGDLSAAPPGACPPVISAQAARFALTIILAILIIWYVIRQCARSKCEGFTVSARSREIQEKAKTVFDRTAGAATYTEYKSAVPSADPVQFSDTRSLWAKGQLTPEKVEAAEHR